MAHSFGVVEDKLWESEFFLGQLQRTRPHSAESRYYFSAFVSAARSVTFAMQFSMSGVDGFEDWYANAQASLRSDPLAPHFVEIRNDVQKKGLNPINAVPLSHLREHLGWRRAKGNRSHVLVLPSASGDGELADASVATNEYFRLLVSVVFDAYETFKATVDPRWYYTEANFAAQGRTLVDALAELGFPAAWAEAAPNGPDAWRVLRAQQPPCALNELFLRYLGRRIADPDEAA
jgi:hypothetical protein